MAIIEVGGARINTDILSDATYRRALAYGLEQLLAAGCQEVVNAIEIKVQKAPEQQA